MQKITIKVELKRRPLNSNARMCDDCAFAVDELHCLDRNLCPWTAETPCNWQFNSKPKVIKKLSENKEGDSATIEYFGG